MANAPTTKSLYRRLLRELPPLPVPRHKAPRTSIHSSIRAHFYQPPASNSEEYMVARRQELEQFAAYLRAQRMYNTLLLRYNPGMSIVDEEERVRLTARRVGMELPAEYEWEKKP
ncbi:hypothetical protein A1O3_02128 [Capronia epimyces CBS 606.96]|uniref:Uncharacterized protein n=1 Tax=Capronia epimyces CBS 606.96 TaxID=1182542 RepID=W9Z3I7_9EURO|nr:uncharacterized protein A1O3_02128 [Capronia epimyces CBS 606.96]EXJ89064.1 hypothetical protein A1O3_02128 [Capronia epimyces CBS 606.96]